MNWACIVCEQYQKYSDVSLDLKGFIEVNLF